MNLKLLSSSLLLLTLFTLSVGAAEKPLKLALNWKAEPQFGGFYAAQDEFKKRGLEVEIQQGGSGTPTLQMLLSGQVDYAVVSADEILIAADRGQRNLKALFATFQKNPQAILVHQETAAQSIQELVHQDGRLLWQEGLPYAQFIRKKYAPIRIKTSPYPGGLQNFITDKSISQQCFATSEPLLLRSQHPEIKFKVFYVAETGYNPYTTVLTTTQERLKKQPEEVHALVQAVTAGWTAYLHDDKKRQDVHALISQLNPSLSAEGLKASELAQRELIETPETKTAGLGSMSLERWQSLASQLLELKVIKSKPPLEEVFQGH